LATTVAVADFRPADPYMQVYEKLHEEWKTVKRDWDEFIKEELSSFQKMMQTETAGPLILSQEEK